MKIEPKDIENGSFNGRYVWVCDYRYNDINDKPIRHVHPQRVLVRSNSELQGKKIYYSESHFVELNSKNKPTSKVIALFDNTGFRSYPGVPVNVFDNEQECLVHYHGQKEEILNMLETWKTRMDHRYQSMKEELLKIEF